jgi:hypothetical protein
MLILAIPLFSFLIISLSFTNLSYDFLPSKLNQSKQVNPQSIFVINITQANFTQQNINLPPPIIPSTILIIIFIFIIGITLTFITISREIRRDFVSRMIAMLLIIIFLIFGARLFLNTPSSNSVLTTGFNLYSVTFLIVFLTIIAILGYSSFYLLRYLKMQNILESKPVVEKIKKEFIDKIEEFNLQYSELKFKSPKEYILKCYKSFCEFIENKGINNPKHYTAREFEIYIQKLLGYNSNYLHDLTIMFEKARYSLENIEERDADKASFLLNCILNDLKNG